MSTIPNLPEAYSADRDPWGAHAPAETHLAGASAQVQVLAGTYWLGDLGLAVPQTYWDALTTHLVDDTNPTAVGFDDTGRPLTIAGDNPSPGPLGALGPLLVLGFTATLGGGTYITSDGVALHTDTGVIGLVPAPVLTWLEPVEQECLPGLGIFVDFSSPTTAALTAGVMVFGKHTLDSTEPNALGPRCTCGSLLVDYRRHLTRDARGEAATAAVTAGGRCAPCRAAHSEPCCADAAAAGQSAARRQGRRTGTPGPAALWASLAAR